MCVYIHIDRYRLTAQHRNYIGLLKHGAGSSAEAGASLAS